MAFTEALRLVIDADASGAVAGINQVGRTAERELGRSQANMDRWGSRLTTLGAGLISFGAVAAYGLNQAAQSAGQLEQAVGGTEAVFDDASGVIDRYARSAAENAGLSETAFRTATTQIGGNLKRLGLDVDEAADRSVELTQVAADLAATYGGTTAEAVTALGAAFRGEADPAERFNLDLKVSKVNAEAVALGLATSTSAVSDHARAQALLSLIMKQSADAQGQFGRESDTLAGRQQILAAQFENLKADIGEGVIPAMQQLFNVAQTGINAFSGLNDATGGAVGKIATVATVAALGVGGLSLLVGQAIKMRQNFSDAISAVSGLTDRVGGLKAAAGIAAGVAGLAGLVIAIDQIEKAAERAEVEKLTKAFLATGDASGLLTEGLENNYNDLKRFGMAFAELAATNEEGARRLVDALEESGASADLVGALRFQLEQTSRANQQSAADAEVNAAAVEGQGDAYSETAGDIGEATSALQDYQDKLAAAFDPLFGMIDAQNGLRDSQSAVAEAQAALNEALASGDATAIAEAQRAYDDALTGSSQALVEAQSAQAVLNDAIARGDVSLEQAQDALYTWAINAGFTGEQALIMAGQLGTATSAAQTLDAQNPTVSIAAEDGATPTIRSVEGAVSALDGRTANVSVRVTATGQAAIDLINQKLLSGERAHGGPVSAGRLYEVAEQGRAELLEMGGRSYLIPGSDGTVVPAGMWGGGGAGGGGYVDNRVFNIQTGSDPQAVVEAIKRYERSNGQAWRN